MKKRNSSKRENRKWLYILPNILTSCSLFGGFYAIITAIQDRYHHAAIVILICLILDGLDGKIARITNTTSQFGAVYDTLSDLIAFGVAPGLLVFEWSLESSGIFGWVGAFLYVILGALRLARSHIKKTILNVATIEGLPIPIAATFIATLVLLMNSSHYLTENERTIIMITIYFLSFLMVSTIDYPGYKELEIFKKKPFNALPVLSIPPFIIIVIYKPALILFLLSTMYVISGPAIIFYHLNRRIVRKLKFIILKM